jgi:biotin carboxyl carrier protein
MTKFRLTIGEKAYSVEVGDTRQLPVTVIVDGETFSVDVQQLEDVSIAASAPAGSLIASSKVATDPAPARGDGQTQVTAPMPGTIMDIAVQVGDAVQEAQVLCALEAMKMKSPIRALRAGTIHQVIVVEGQTVEHGDLLFVVG